MTLPSIDSLRSDCTKIHFFGLGFIQVKTNNPWLRYHFYHPSLECLADNPHNHRYFFTSEVLRGSLENIVWSTYDPHFLAPTDAIVVNETLTDCSPAKIFTSDKSVLAKAVTSFQTHDGSSYFMPSDLFHQVKRIGKAPCVTRLTLGPKFKVNASVLQVHPEQCPFSHQRNEEDLWALVAECL